jgi:hypothetical protein
MKIVFNIEKYTVTLTEHDWNCNTIPQKGDKIELFNFLEKNDENVSYSDKTIQEMNKATRQGIVQVRDFFCGRFFTVSDIIWTKYESEVGCQIDLID